VTVRRVESARDLDQFVKLPFRLYRGDPNWVPPLIGDAKRTLTPGQNPFWNHADRELYLAVRDGKVVGRVAAILDRSYNECHDTHVACFGFFELEDDIEVAKALFAAVKAFARSRGAGTVYGPANPSLNDEVALLIDPFDSPPMVKMSYNPPYYVQLIEKSGFTKVKDFYAYSIQTDAPIPEKLQRVMAKLKEKPGLVVRPADLTRVEAELALIKEVYNDAWSSNWDHVPMTDGEIADLARQLRPLIRPEICPFVFYKGEVAGMCVALPDYNQVLKKMNGRLFPFGWFTFLTQRGKINQARLWALGVKRKFHNLGYDSLLYYESFMGARKLGYKWGEVSMILEDNVSIIRPIQMWGGKLYKTFRVYQCPA
jgi:GNAT superfamily N-acetyltransferase